MKTFTIGISCIGSGVGQSIINSIRLSGLSLKTIGLGNNPFAYGAYDCDEYDYTPAVTADDYLDKLVKKCHQHKIDLLIPGFDDEVLILAQNREKLDRTGIKIIVADKKFIALCRNKDQMSIELNKVTDVFAQNYDKETLEQDIDSKKVKFPFIAKPRGGSASQGIEIIGSKEDLVKINDGHILQKIAMPHKKDPSYSCYVSAISKNRNLQVSEISIQIVVDPSGNLLGRMASHNKLKNGVPIEIIPFENEIVWTVVDKLMPTFLKLGLRGPLNIQGRLTDGGLKLFEMNPRFTGITGLRALMGFNEVEACVKEWLGIDKGKNSLRVACNRFGMRQTADRSLPIERNEQVAIRVTHLHPEWIKKRKTIFITGACGYLGQNLIDELLKNNLFEIWAFGQNKKKTESLFAGKVHACFDKKDLTNGLIQPGNIDVLLHLGFARPHCTNREISASLEFTQELFTRAAANQVPAIINISSQSVYGLETEPLWKECTPVAPASVYAQAKYAAELLLRSLKKINPQLSCSSLRMGTLAGGAEGLTEVDFLSRIVRQAYEGKAIRISGGTQLIERLDIRDAVGALIKMLASDPVHWQPVYNLGSGERNTLLDIALKVIAIAPEYNGGLRSEISVEEKNGNVKCGMDSKLFSKEMNWRPKFKIIHTVESLLKYFKSK